MHASEIKAKPQNTTTWTRDDEGYLVHPDDWNSDFCQMVAKEENIALSRKHIEIITFIRQYFHEHRVIPDVRHVTTELVKKRNISKKEAKKLLFDCFPYGYVRQACKIAGMKKPRAWSTG